MTNKQPFAILSDDIVVNKIYEIRNLKVMLDSDLAELYGVETKVLNQAVKRNMERFPDDFMFQLTEDEWQNLKSQFVTSSWGGRRKLPFAFSEHGVLMLSSVLSSQQAIQVNIQIVRIFSRLRKLMSEHSEFKLEMVDVKKKLEPRRRIGYMPDDL